MDKEEYLTERVQPQQKYFSKTASKNKRQYYWLSVLKLCASLSITIISSVAVEDPIISVTIAIISALLTLFEAILLLFGCHENWIMSRMTSEYLKRETFLFQTNACEYKELTQDEAFAVFVENIESIIQNTNEQWRANHSTKKDEK